MKYYLKINTYRYKQVSIKEYMKWERFCGFRSKFKTKPACGSFTFVDFNSNMEIKGKTVK